MEGLTNHILLLQRHRIDNQNLEIRLSRAIGSGVTSAQLCQGVERLEIFRVRIVLTEVDVAAAVGLTDQCPHQALDHFLQLNEITPAQKSPKMHEVLLGRECVVVLYDFQAGELDIDGLGQ